jgi:DNA repair exonuclease SbcCD ATPase subunit
MITTRDIKEPLQTSIGWILREFYFFKQLQDDLKELKTDISHAKKKEEVKDIKDALRDFKYIGRAEKRFDVYEKEFEEKLAALKKEITVTGTIEEIERLSERIHTEAASLVRDASFYDSKLKDYLSHLKHHIDEIESAHAVIMEIEQIIEEAENWIRALLIDFEKAKKLVEETTNPKELKDKADSYFWGRRYKLAALLYEKAGEIDKAIDAWCFEGGNINEAETLLRRQGIKSKMRRLDRIEKVMKQNDSAWAKLEPIIENRRKSYYDYCREKNYTPGHVPVLDY